MQATFTNDGGMKKGETVQTAEGGAAHAEPCMHELVQGWSVGMPSDPDLMHVLLLQALVE